MKKRSDAGNIKDTMKKSNTGNKKDTENKRNIKKNGTENNRKWLYYGIQFILLVIMLVMLGKIVNHLVDERKSRKFADNLEQAAFSGMEEAENGVEAGAGESGKVSGAGTEESATGNGGEVRPGENGKVSGAGTEESTAGNGGEVQLGENGKVSGAGTAKTGGNPDVGTAKPGKEQQDSKIRETLNFDAIWEIGEAAVAWLYSPDTRINYVVAQGEDNDYFLHRLLSGGDAKEGTLFVDFRNSPDFTDSNTIIYGHNMKSGSMFGSLHRYEKQEYYEEHPVMYLYVPGNRYTLELLAGCYVGVENPIFSAIPPSEEERDSILYQAYHNSTFVSGITAGKEDRLVTLSTCAGDDTLRYVIIGRIAEEYLQKEENPVQ